MRGGGNAAPHVTSANGNLALASKHYRPAPLPALRTKSPQLLQLR